MNTSFEPQPHTPNILAAVSPATILVGSLGLFGLFMLGNGKTAEATPGSTIPTAETPDSTSPPVDSIPIDPTTTTTTVPVIFEFDYFGHGDVVCDKNGDIYPVPPYPANICAIVSLELPETGSNLNLTMTAGAAGALMLVGGLARLLSKRDIDDIT